MQDPPQSHAFAQTRHNERVGDREKRQVLVERQVLRVQEYHRLIRQCGEARVDVRHGLRDAALKLVLLGSL